MHTLKIFTLTLSMVAACTSEPGDPATTTEATGTTHASDHAHDTTAGETHAHDTGSETHAHETEGHEPTTGGETGEATPVDAYCACMVDACHDQYHGMWGEDHHEAEAMCKAAAGMVPSVGVPAMSGDSIECRLHFCEAAVADESQCAAAVGGAPCV